MITLTLSDANEWFISGSQQNLRTHRHKQFRNMINNMSIRKRKRLEIKSFATTSVNKLTSPTRSWVIAGDTFC